MSDNIATARSLHEEYGRKQCWEEQQEPIAVSAVTTEQSVASRFFICRSRG